MEKRIIFADVENQRIREITEDDDLEYYGAGWLYIESDDGSNKKLNKNELYKAYWNHMAH
jgi:hypothetical protein